MSVRGGESCLEVLFSLSSKAVWYAQVPKYFQETRHIQTRLGKNSKVKHWICWNALNLFLGTLNDQAQGADRGQGLGDNASET